MSNNPHAEAYNISMGRYQSQIIDAETAYRKAELMGDEMGMSDAHMELASLKVQANEAHQLAVQHANSIRPVDTGSRYPLSKDELEIARGGYGNIPNDEKDKIYFENKQKLARMRASGDYRDDQGTVRR